MLPQLNLTLGCRPSVKVALEEVVAAAVAQEAQEVQETKEAKEA